MIALTIYSRPGCHLCDEMKAVVRRVLQSTPPTAQVHVDEVDISTNADLEARYGLEIPVLMLNGRYDYQFPLEASPRPLFRLLGTPDADKKLVVYETGHSDLPHGEEVRATLDWLDKYLGPVR